ncbi:glutathione S-transferase 1-like [Oppia nitens]|uniref:glutathione S-transferase 1-like n=1 Tax=Oppia nitens TaxID=1686743 RepID=UPI0023DCB398|nr:glutathione S-transferase 1-like [Oppia nitens]XP_054159052.1 glutathione S-transferase 1-like [Oppia nitens]
MMTRKMVIDLYFVGPSPPCRAVMMAAKHLNINLNPKYVDLMKGEQKEEWFLKLNPQHCLPTICDNGYVLWESRAIMCYLANKYAPNSSLYPSDPQKRAEVDRILQWDLGTIYRTIGEYLAPILRDTKNPNDLDPEKGKKIREALQIMDQMLNNQPFLAGNEITLADLSVLASLSLAEVFDYDLIGEYKNVKRWSDGLKRDLPYYDEINKEPIGMFRAHIKSKVTDLNGQQNTGNH